MLGQIGQVGQVGQLPHCFSLLTLIFYGYYPLYVYEYLVSLRIGMVKRIGYLYILWEGTLLLISFITVH